MKVALVHDWLVGMRGGEKCLEVLCRRFPAATLHTLLWKRGAASPAIERLPIQTSFLDRLPQIARWYRYSLPLMPLAVGQLTVDPDVDLVVSFSHAVAKAVRVPPGVPHVCYCFTPMRYAWDMRDEYFPAASSQTSAGLRTQAARPVHWLRNRLLDRLQAWDHATADGVTHFIAISETIARRITECYGRSSRTICPPVDTDFYTPTGVARDDFYLCVSALVPYKRLELAIEACNQLRRRLVIVGTGPERARLARIAGPTIELRGWQPNEEIRDLFRRCRALLFPGLEDFGIVPLEAMACGAPVIAFGRGGASETVRDPTAIDPGTGLLFTHQTAEDLASAMLRLEAHPELCSPVLARRQALRYSLARFEHELMEYLDEVVHRPRALAA